MELLQHIGIALFGWVLWNVVLWGIAHDEADEKKQKFNWKEYKATHTDDAIVSFCFVPVIAGFGPEIWGVITSLIPGTGEVSFSKMFYLGAGPLTQLAYFGAKWIIKYARKLRAKLNG